MVTFKDLGKYGRLGNQMFQIASTIGIAYKNDDIAVFPKWENSEFFKNPINQELVDSEISFHYNEPSFNYNDVPYKKDMNLHGYFQSEKYFQQCSDLIRYYFEPNQEIIYRLKSKYDSIVNSNTCSIHIRRGDYVGTMHDVCDLKYYYKAINLIESNTKVDTYIVFSDDINWCKYELRETHFSDINLQFIDGNTPIEDLFLMSLCTNNIICNSSFSWWAAYLNKYKDKIIIAPDIWFKSEYNMNDLDIYIPSMNKIKV